MGQVVKYIVLIYGILNLYHVLFAIVGFFTRPRPLPKARKDHSYAIVISARNEERVIGHLLDSIRLQDYDPSLLRVFVVADNCSDGTASLCREKGAIVYERHDPEHARKGWALEYLFEQIDRDYGIESVDGYLFFDADNLLAKNYVTEINKAFDQCGDIAVGYRNTKNFDTNFISAAYGFHFYQSTMYLHRPRNFFHLSTHIAGTGYVVASSILKDGWHWTCLTEDTQFCLTQIAQGRKIQYCESAEFFDEQPYTVPVMLRQRLRWVKGRLACFFIIFPKLIAGMFRCRERKFSCYDMFFYILPNAIISVIYSALSLVIFAATGIAASGVRGFLLTDIPAALPALLKGLGASWLSLAVVGALLAIRERPHIRCSGGKLALYTLLWPFFDIIGPFIALASLFMRVRWKPIRHDRDIAIGELEATGKR